MSAWLTYVSRDAAKLRRARTKLVPLLVRLRRICYRPVQPELGELFNLPRFLGDGTGLLLAFFCFFADSLVCHFSIVPRCEGT